MVLVAGVDVGKAGERAMALARADPAVAAKDFLDLAFDRMQRRITKLNGAASS
jgi:hypothetical protein